jgi:hypothetical protein
MSHSSRYLPDYDVVHGAGVGHGGSSAAWVVQAALPASAANDPYHNSSPQPLIPLNASSRYSLSAWVSDLTLTHLSTGTIAMVFRNNCIRADHHQNNIAMIFRTTSHSIFISS